MRFRYTNGNFRSTIARRELDSRAAPLFIFPCRPRFFLCLYQSTLLFVVADKLYKPVSNIRAGTRSVKIRFFFIFFPLVSLNVFDARDQPDSIWWPLKRERERGRKKGGKIARARENEERPEKERKVRTPCTHHGELLILPDECMFKGLLARVIDGLS